ncbi:hypothetical protein [Wolbachia endosymbiont of Cantharis cryptica]|uniref:hypothetical protein n=1 Tax=Wolbachia endosymbiont of Cantharis cryptica TaxID=3066132 RepID=UPI00376ECBA0
MPKYTKKYINNIAESNILGVYTSEDNSQIRVFFKTVNGENSRIFSGQEVVKFLNRTTDVRDHKRELAISGNIKKGIIKDIKGIYRKNGRYIYEIQDLLPDAQYEELFESEQAIQCDLNDFMSDSISQSVYLKDRFEEILDFDPEEGLCHPLNYFIVCTKLKNKEDFTKLLRTCLKSSQ